MAYILPICKSRSSTCCKGRNISILYEHGPLYVCACALCVWGLRVANLAFSGDAEEVSHGLPDNTRGGDGPLHGERLPGARLPVRHHADIEAIKSTLHKRLDLGVDVLLAGL